MWLVELVGECLTYWLEMEFCYRLSCRLVGKKPSKRIHI